MGFADGQGFTIIGTSSFGRSSHIEVVLQVWLLLEDRDLHGGGSPMLLQRFLLLSLVLMVLLLRSLLVLLLFCTWPLLKVARRNSFCRLMLLRTPRLVLYRWSLRWQLR